VNGVAATTSIPTEPWYNQATNGVATLNTQNIYQIGSVAIGTTSSATGKALTVNGDVKISGVLDPTKILFGDPGAMNSSYDPSANNEYQIDFAARNLTLFGNSTTRATPNLYLGSTGINAIGTSTVTTLSTGATRGLVIDSRTLSTSGLRLANLLPSIAGASGIFASVGLNPYGIAIDSAGNIYTANYSSANVTKITPAGTSTTLGGTGANPIGIVVDSSGNVYTANYGANTVTKITPAGTSTVFATTTGNGPFNIAIDLAGNIYTANYSSANVTKITPAGTASTLGSTGSNPVGIAVDSAGNVYTANYGANNVTKITAGGISTTLGSTGSNPYGLTIDAAGNVYTANFTSDNVSKITSGGVSSILGTVGDGPYNLTIDLAGNVYASNYNSSNVSKITPTGVVTTLGTTGSNPYGITVDPAGNVYTANYNSNNVSKMTNPDSNVLTTDATGNVIMTDVVSRNTLSSVVTSINAGILNAINNISPLSFFIGSSSSTPATSSLNLLISTTSSSTTFTLSNNPIFNSIRAIVGYFGSLFFDSATGTNITATGTATINNLVATTSTFVNLNTTNATLTNATSTNLFASSTIFNKSVITNASITNATTTNFFSNLINAVTGYFGSLFFNSATGTNITATGTATINNLVATTSTFINASSTNFYSSTTRTNVLTVGTSTFTSGKVATFYGDIDVTGTIDPTRILFSDGYSPSFNPVTNNEYQIDFTGRNLNFVNNFATRTTPTLYLGQDGITRIGTTTATIATSTRGLVIESGITDTSGLRLTNIKPATTGFATTLATTGSNPYSIVIDKSGNLYTANYIGLNISKITSSGSSTVLATLASSPRAITIDANGNLYTANPNADNVYKITPGGTVTTHGTTGSSPYGVAVDIFGNVYTANYSSNNVTKITPSGASSILGTTGNNPIGIAVDSAGNVYTANYGSNNVTKITPGGASSTLGTTGSSPYGIVLDPAGNVYTANSGSNNVSKITQTGSSAIIATTTGSIPLSIAIDLAGNVYTANSTGNNVTKITQGGTVTTLGTTGSNPYGITLDTMGVVYTANYGTSNVTKMTNPDAAALSTDALGNVIMSSVVSTETLSGIVTSLSSSITNSLTNSWSTSGNANTVPGLNFIGTTDAQDLVFATNAAEAMRINTGGELVIGTSSDVGAYKLQVVGDIFTKGSLTLRNTSNVDATITHDIADNFAFSRPITSTQFGSTAGGVGVGMTLSSSDIILGVNTSTFRVKGTGVTIGTGFIGGGTPPANGLEVQGETFLGSQTDAGAFQLQVTGDEYISGALRIGTTGSDGSKLYVLGGDISVHTGGYRSNDGNGYYGGFGASNGGWNISNMGVQAARIGYLGNIFEAGMIINENSLDSDTRIEGDTEANLFFVDASTDRIGIGTSTPAALFSVGASSQFQVNSSGNILGVFSNVATDTDKFLVSDSGTIKYRTGAEILSDIGAAPITGGTGYIQNQSASAQATSSFWISGNGRMDGTLQVGTLIISGTATNQIAIGGTTTGDSSVALGTSASAALQGIAIGESASAAQNSIALGRGASAGSNQFVVGGANNSISDIYFGRGVTNATVDGVTLNANGAFGTNIAGASIALASGKATGNAVGGSILFQTSDATASGTALQTLSTKATILANGNFGIGTLAPTNKLEVVGTFKASSTSTNAAIFELGTEGVFRVLGNAGGDRFTINDSIHTTWAYQFSSANFTTWSNSWSRFNGGYIQYMNNVYNAVYSPEGFKILKINPETTNAIAFAIDDDGTAPHANYRPLTIKVNSVEKMYVNKDGHIVSTAAGITTNNASYFQAPTDVVPIAIYPTGTVGMGLQVQAATIPSISLNMTSVVARGIGIINSSGDIAINCPSFSCGNTQVFHGDGRLTLGSIPNATSDLDKFLVSDSGTIKYRTGAEILSDIGAAPASYGTGYIQNQVGAAQTAGFWINGNATVGNSIIESVSKGFLTADNSVTGAVGIGIETPKLNLRHQFYPFINNLVVNNQAAATEDVSISGGHLSSYGDDITANHKILSVTTSDGYNTTSTALTSYGGYFTNASVRNVGANALTNIGLYVSASGAQNNYAAIFANGNVGIGTIAPTYTLDVQAVLAQLQIKSTTGTNFAIARFNNTGGDMYIGRESSIGGNVISGSAAYSGVINVVGAYPLHLGANNTIGLTIDSASEVLIGSTSDLGAYKLQVTGDALVSSTNTGLNSFTQLTATGTNSGKTALNSVLDINAIGPFTLNNSAGIYSTLKANYATVQSGTLGLSNVIADTQVLNGGTIDSVRGFLSFPQASGSGVISNYYGLYLKAASTSSGGAITNMNSLFAEAGAGNATIGDELHIGTTTDLGADKLQVTGGSRFNGNVEIAPVDTNAYLVMRSPNGMYYPQIQFYSNNVDTGSLSGYNGGITAYGNYFTVDKSLTAAQTSGNVQFGSTANTGQVVASFKQSSNINLGLLVGYQANGNNDAYIYQSENAALSFSTNAIQRLNIAANGLITMPTMVSISNNSTTSANKSLEVTQTGATSGTDYAGYFSNTGAATVNIGLYSTASGGTNNYAAQLAGHTVIGTDFPTGSSITNYKLTVGGRTQIGQTIGYDMGNHYLNVSSPGQSNIAIFSSDQGTGQITVRSSEYYTDYWTGGDAGGIKMTGNEKISWYGGSVVINEPGNDLDFRVEGVSDTNLFFVDASTNRVGIGTNVPAQRLTVGATAAVSGTVSQTNISAFAGGGIQIRATDAGASSQDALTYYSSSGGGGAAIAFGRGTSWDTFMSFYTNNTAATGAISEAMRINNEQELMIGTTTDAGTFKLQVIGNSYLSGNVGIGTTAPTGVLSINSSQPASVGSGNGTNALPLLNTIANAGKGGDTSANSGTVSGGTGGGIILTAGEGGSITGTPGTGFGGAGGNLSFDAGTGGSGTTFGGAGGYINIGGGTGGVSTGTGGTPGYVAIKGGNASAIGNNAGADVYLIGGIPNGTGLSGNVLFNVSPSLQVRGFTGVGTFVPNYRLDVLQDYNTTVQTASNRVANFSNAGALFNTTSGALISYTGYFESTSTRSTGGNTLTNIALYASAGGAQNNYSGIFDAGSVGIGDTTPDYKLDVADTSIDNNIFSLTDSDGECLYNPESGSVTVTCSSDERLKTNIVDAPSALLYFKPIKVREYNVLASGDQVTGVIAQEIMQIHPDLVTVGASGMYSVEMPNTWQIVRAIQELDQKFEDGPIFASVGSSTLVNNTIKNSLNNLALVLASTTDTNIASSTLADLDSLFSTSSLASIHALTNALTLENSDLDLNGNALKNVKAIESASSNWSIDANGLIRAKYLRAEGVELKDVDGNWYCYKSEYGNLVKVGVAPCTENSNNANNNPSPENTPTPTPDPTPVPDPVPEPDPTPTPDPIPTPVPDPTPVLDPVPEPTPIPDPVPEPASPAVDPPVEPAP
jgi:streptogramin lyase